MARKVFWTVFCTALFLLMLSALVVSPSEGVLPAEPPTHVAARLMSAALPTADIPVAPTRPAPERALAVCVLLLCALSLPVSHQSDANGRVLQARRYENSFYQVFRQEVAGG